MKKSNFNYSVDEYLKLRRQLGFKLKDAEILLKKFAIFLESKGATYVTIELIRSFANQSNKASTKQKSVKVTTIRQFAFYLKGLEPKTEIPPNQLFPCTYHRTNPYI